MELRGLDPYTARNKGHALLSCVDADPQDAVRSRQAGPGGLLHLLAFYIKHTCMPYHLLQLQIRKTLSGRAKLGLEAFAEALLGLAKALAENSGHDVQEAIIKLQVGHVY